jgi:hypothetical protein
LLAGGAALSLCLVGAVLHGLRLPPFEEHKGEIKASEVCGTLGPSASSAAALRRVLPDESSYSFDDAVTDPRRDDRDRSYRASCFVNGDGRMLLVATAEMARYEKTGDWVKEVLANQSTAVPASSLVPFAAGDKAVASSKLAAVYLPCVGNGAGAHLSVVVELRRTGGATEAELRDGLVALAKGAALSAHRNAKCDAPSKVA